MEKRNKVKRPESSHTDHSRAAYKGIRRMLYYKDLVPGQKVGCRELAERMEMSLTPVIQALKLLEFQGFVRHEPNRGYYMEPLSLKELEEIYEFRELLEPSLIPGTVSNLDAEGVQKLKGALEAHRSAAREPYLANERFFRNVEFHLALASLSGKTTQVRILENLFDVLLLKYGGNYLPVESMESSDQEHRKTLECVASGDIPGARAALARHIYTVKRRVIAGFRRLLEEKDKREF
jgi:DNA-binding GntR family transcriptional regulator